MLAKLVRTMVRTVMTAPGRKQVLQFICQFGAFLLARVGFWSCFSMLMLFAERADAKRKPDIPVPYLYVDMGVAVLCASFMSFDVKRRWFSLAAAGQLTVSSYVSYIGEQVQYGEWLKVRMYSRVLAIIGGFLVLASGAGEVYRQRPRDRSLQSSGQVFLGIYLVCVVFTLQHSQEDRLAYINYIPGGWFTVMLLMLLHAALALAFLSGYYIRPAAQIMATLLPLVVLFNDGNLGYWHDTCKVEYWNQMKLIGHHAAIFGTMLILAIDG